MEEAKQLKSDATEVYTRLRAEGIKQEIAALKLAVATANASKVGSYKATKPVFRTKIDPNEAMDMFASLKLNPWPRPQNAKEAAMQAALAGFQCYAAAYAITAKAATASAALSAVTASAVCMHKIHQTVEMVDKVELKEVDAVAKNGAKHAHMMQKDASFDFYLTVSLQPAHKLAAAYYNQGLLYGDMGRFSDAVKALVRGSTFHHGGYVPMVRERAENRQKLGQMLQAEADFILTENMLKACLQLEQGRRVQKTVERKRANREMAKLEDTQNIERIRLEHKHKKAASKLTKSHNKALEELFAEQKAVMEELKQENRRQQRVQREKIQAIPLEERNPDDVKQLLDAHAVAESDLAEEQSKAAETLVNGQSAEADEVAKQQEEQVAALEEKHETGKARLLPQTDSEKHVAFMLEQAGRLWDIQHGHNEETATDDMRALLVKAEAASKKRRRVYLPLGAFSGDYYRGFDLKPEGEGWRRRSHPKESHRVDQIAKHLFTSWPSDVENRREEEIEMKKIREDMRKERRDDRNEFRDRAKELLNEKRERTEMKRLEDWQREMDKLIEAERIRKLQEMERERREREMMQFEETYQKWVVAEIKRIEEEERKRLEMERLRREKEALQAKRQARRGRAAKIETLQASKQGKSKKKKKKKQAAESSSSSAPAPPQMPTFD
jgi:hypothetical protein